MQREWNKEKCGNGVTYLIDSRHVSGVCVCAVSFHVMCSDVVMMQRLLKQTENAAFVLLSQAALRTQPSQSRGGITHHFRPLLLLLGICGRR